MACLTQQVHVTGSRQLSLPLPGPLPKGEGMACLTQQVHVTGSHQLSLPLPGPLPKEEGMVGLIHQIRVTGSRQLSLPLPDTLPGGGRMACLTQQSHVTGSKPTVQLPPSRREGEWSNNPCMFFNLTSMYFGFTPSPSVRERVGERVYLSADRESHEEHSGYQTKSRDSRI